MFRAFVAGATGYTGREVVRQLCERGGAVTAHVRPGSPSAARWASQFRGWGAEVAEVAWELAPLTAVMAERRPDLVFSCIGVTRASARRDRLGDGDIYQQVDVRLNALLVEAVRAAGLAPRFVYLSSIGASEGARSKYLASRAQAEATVAGSGLPYTIARPSFIAGPGRDDGRALERVAAGASDGFLAVAGLLGARRFRDRFRSIDNVQLARALIAAALDPSCAGQILGGDRLQPLARA
ncbi:MAG TPA: NAD(P)H-binding protein [Kofleriaceae bacterium]|nr:NAD(P)H-binding protein [Kofleriaceae bacterium]